MKLYLTNHKGVRFTRDPYVANGLNKGWVVMAYSDDKTLYNGRYVMPVGYDSQGMPFKTRKLARAALNNNLAINGGVLKEV